MIIGINDPVVMWATQYDCCPLIFDCSFFEYISLAQRDKELSGETNFFELGPVLNCLQQYLNTVQKSKLHIFSKYLKIEAKNNFSHCNIYKIQTQKAYYLSSTKAPDSSLSRWASDLAKEMKQLQ